MSRDGLFQNPNPTPLESAEEKEDHERILHNMLRMLTFFECELVVGTALEGKTQASYCETYSIDRSTLNEMVQAALRKLGRNCVWNQN